MRQLILKRIAELKKLHDGFPKNSMRWKNFYASEDKKENHISNFDFETLKDEDLLIEFERILRQHGKCM